jgi:uncharacterized membrane protein YjdF
MNDDLRAAREQQWQAYLASRRYTLTTLAVTLAFLWTAILLNILLAPFQWAARLIVRVLSSGDSR